MSLWLTSGGDPAQIATRAGHSVAVLLTVYSHCIHGRDDLLNQQIDHVLKPFPGSGPCPSATKPAVWTDHATQPKGQRLHRGKSSGCTNLDGRDAVRHASVIAPPGPPMAPGSRQHQTGTPTPTSII